MKPAPTTAKDRGPSAALASLPLAFIPARQGYVARGAGYALQLSGAGMTLRLDRGSRSPTLVTTTLEGAARARPVAERRLAGIVNVYRGPSARENIPTISRIRYRSVYPGIDAVFHGRQSRLEYDFEVGPGADPRQIALSHRGARSTTLAANGDLLLHLSGGVIREARPVAYQVIGGRRIHVEASYRLRGGRVGFKIGAYDRARELVIDPILSYSSYLGGSDYDFLTSVAVGADKSVYITGRTLSNDFPGGTRDNARTDLDAFVTKLNPDASRVYTTYIGSTGADQASDVAADSSGRAYVVGDTDSTSFAPFALDSCLDGGNDAFVVRLNTSGGRDYASCIGADGYDVASGIALRETAGTVEAYVVGTASGSVAGGFPQNNGFQQTCCTGVATWLAKVSFGASVTIPYLTFIDGGSDDYGRAVGVDSSGNAYVAGGSMSNPLGGTAKPGGANQGVFVTKVNPATTGAGSKVYSTWIDGSGNEDVGNPYGTPSTNGGIAVNSAGVAYVAGSTGSSNLPQKVTSDTFKYVSGDAGFIGVIGADGSVARTIYVDGTGATHLGDLALQEIGGVTSIYAVGDTDGAITGLNTLSGQSCSETSANHPDVLLVKIADGASPSGLYLTCLGGSGDDGGASIAIGPGTDATAWFVGTTTGSFPTVNPRQANANAVTDGFVARIGQKAPVIDSGPDDGAVIPSGNVTFTFSTDQPALTFQCSVPDAGRLVAGHALGACSGSGTATYSDLASGQHTFEVATIDAGGAQSVATRTFTVNSAPPNASYTIAPNPVLVGRPATFDAGASTPTSGPIARYEWDLDGDGSFETDGGVSSTTTKAYTTAGTVNTALRVTDSTGGMGVASVALRVTDSSTSGNPVGVSINRGAQYTNKPDVTLTIVSPPGATALLIANDGGFLGAVSQAVASQVKWRLDSSGPERLPKTVYLRFLTGTFASPNYTDDIILDERPPVVDSASIAGPPAASATAVAARAKTWRLKVRARDTNSGVGGVQVTVNKRKPGKLIAYKKSLKVKSAKRPKFLRARDRAGNFSGWKKLR